MSERIFSVIGKELQVKTHQVEAAVRLLDEGNTVPFIARYRKEATGELNDEQLRQLAERLTYLRNLEERRTDIIASIESQEKMTDELRHALEQAIKLQELEDLYLPYRPKKRTRASMARERGLEPLSVMLREGAKGEPLALAADFMGAEVETPEAALQGAMDILAEDVSDRADIRQYLRNRMWKEGVIVTTLQEDAPEKDKFLAYGDDYEEPIRQIPPHRILAINRGESLGALKVSFRMPDEVYVAYMQGQEASQKASLFDTYKEAAIEDSYKRLIYPALERELRNALTEKADEQAIKVFGVNLKNVLLQAPLADHVIMGLDPGYRTGCKMAIIDAQGNVLDTGTYYFTLPTKDVEKENRAKVALAKKIKEYGVTLISIGNGTASYETEQFVSNLIQECKLDAHYIITNEAGASVYSASKLGADELPDLDVSIRGAVSIARRVQDPLAESVKIDPKSIGVGQYQHDVNQKALQDTLDQVVEDVVNHVGVELNTASPAILKHIAGISSTVANNIVEFRRESGRFKSRKELLKVARLGPAAFKQCAGFLRIQGGKNPLDNTSVHPESYDIAEALLEQLGHSLQSLDDKVQLDRLQGQLMLVDVEDMAKRLGAGVPTLRDIVGALQKPGRDPREDLPAPLTRKHILTLDELEAGSVVQGTVQNVVDFGAFVDIGLKVAGLLHRSQFCTMKQHPSQILAVGDIIEAEVLSVDGARNRIGLALTADMKKQLGIQKKNEGPRLRRKNG